MARFSVDPGKLPEIGRALAKAVTDEEARAAYIKDPKAYLIDAGVDPSALAGLDLSVVEDTTTHLNLVLPARIDEAKVAGNDSDYLAELGISVVLTCHL